MIKGIAFLIGKCNGYIKIREDGKNNAIININITNLPPNSSHAFHIHETGDISEGCKSLKAHYNPHNKDHGGPNDHNRHVGDFGNLTSDNKGRIMKSIKAKNVKLRGKYSVIGRSFVIHEGIDDLGKGNTKESKITGNAGGRMACGIIGYAKDSQLYF